MYPDFQEQSLKTVPMLGTTHTYELQILYVIPFIEGKRFKGSLAAMHCILLLFPAR